jgi:glycine C-acetyltransferase
MTTTDYEADTKTQYLADQIADLQSQGLYNRIRTIDSPMDGHVVINGKQVLNLCANNYLGLANHPRLKEAAKKAIDQYGIGPGAVRTIAGTLSLHDKLEQRLAEFKKAEAVVTLQSGFAANLATIPALVTKGDVIFSDRLNHASIIDGCRLSRASIVAYEHNSPDDLRQKIAEPSDCDRWRFQHGW